MKQNLMEKTDTNNNKNNIVINKILMKLKYAEFSQFVGKQIPY